MYTVTLKLKTNSFDEYEIHKSFNIAAHIHNAVVKHAIKLLTQLEHNKEYQDLLSEYREANKISDEAKRKRAKSKPAKKMKAIREEIGLTDEGLQKYIKICGRMYSHLLSSQQVQKEASRVYKGVEKHLFGNGNKIHFKKRSEIKTISGKTNTNGIKFDKETLSINWLGLHIKCKQPKKAKDIHYLNEAMKGEVRYCEISRKMFPNGYHYYVIIYMKGEAPKTASIGKGTMGIDPGVSAIAAVTDEVAILKELAPKCKEYNAKIKAVLLKMDEIRRRHNPNKYNPDGTINKKNKDKWILPKSYFKLKRRLAYLYRAKREYTKHSHNRLCNILLAMADTFIIEKMNFSALTRRAKKTERSDKESSVKGKKMFKFKRKKRFGKSINDRSPALIISTLERKANQYGGNVFYIDTKAYKASQYDHVKDSYIREARKLILRFKKIGEHTVQRDLYSAYLIKNTDETLKHPNRQSCLKDFDKFISIHNVCVNKMRQNNVSMKQCFGF